MLKNFFKFIEKWSQVGSDNAHAIYSRIAEQARNPDFYTRYGVADTFDGRFDTLTLIAVLVLRRLRAAGDEGKRMAQSVTDVMFADMDLSLHEIGVSENKVSKKIKIMAAAFLGRMNAYNDAIDKGDGAMLGEALRRNLYRDDGTDPQNPVSNDLIDLVLAAAARLDSLDDAAVLKGDIAPIFPQFLEDGNDR